jgi:hypothetical protein
MVKHPLPGLTSVQKTITDSEIKWGQLKVTKPMQGIFPPFDSNHRRQRIIIEANGKDFECLYDNDYKRVRSMHRIFLALGVNVGYSVEITVLSPSERYKFTFRDPRT